MCGLAIEQQWLQSPCQAPAVPVCQAASVSCSLRSTPDPFYLIKGVDFFRRPVLDDASPSCCGVERYFVLQDLAYHADINRRYQSVNQKISFLFSLGDQDCSPCSIRTIVLAMRLFAHRFIRLCLEGFATMQCVFCCGTLGIRSLLLLRSWVSHRTL